MPANFYSYLQFDSFFSVLFICENTYILQLFLSYFVPYNVSVATEHTTTMMSYYAVALVTQFFCLSLCTFCLFVKIYATTKVKKKDGNVCLEEISKSSVCNDVFFVSCVLCVYVFDDDDVSIM